MIDSTMRVFGLSLLVFTLASATACSEKKEKSATDSAPTMKSTAKKTTTMKSTAKKTPSTKAPPVMFCGKEIPATATRVFCKDAKDIAPLAALKNLKQVDLCWLTDERCVFSDISPLKGLASLEKLRLGNSWVVDLRPLAGLASLKELELAKTIADDFTPLHGLTALEELDLSSAKGVSNKSIRGLGKLKNLRKLDLGGTNVTSLSELGALTKLEELNLNKTRVVDLSGIEPLKALRVLILANTRIPDLGPIAALPGLIEISMFRANASNLSPLKDLPLKRINLRQSRGLADISPLSSVRTLERLEVVNDDVSLTSLSSLPNLRVLWAHGGRGLEMLASGSFPKLETLHLYGRKKTGLDLTEFSSTPSLKELKLDRVWVKSSKGLAEAKSLETIVLKRVRLDDVMPLEKLRNLKMVECEKGQVSDEQSRDARLANPALKIRIR